MGSQIAICFHNLKQRKRQALKECNKYFKQDAHKPAPTFQEPWRSHCIGSCTGKIGNAWPESYCIKIVCAICWRLSKRMPIPQGSGEAPPGSRCLWSHPCGGRTWEKEMIEWRLSQTLFFLNLPVQSKDWDPDAILDKLYIVHQLIAEKRRFVC